MPNLVATRAAAAWFDPPEPLQGRDFRSARSLARVVHPCGSGCGSEVPMLVQASSGSAATIAVWIERADGTILGGSAETVSARSARVLLPGRHAFRPDEPVRLRICFSPERPTVAASALVRWTRQLGDAVDCGLDWDLGTVEFESCPAQPGV